MKYNRRMQLALIRKDFCQYIEHVGWVYDNKRVWRDSGLALLD